MAGASVWAGGSQVWKGNVGVLTARPSRIAASTKPPATALPWKGGERGELDHVERVRVRAHVEADEAEQQGQRAQERVEEELQRRPGRVAVSPAGDHEVHGDDGEVEEDEEHQQVGGREQPQRDALEEEEQGGLGPGPVLVAEGVDGAGGEDQGRHQHQRQGDPVQPDVVAASRRRGSSPPGCRMRARRRRAVVAPPQGGGERQLDQRGGDERGCTARGGSAGTATRAIATTRGRKTRTESTLTSCSG